MINPGNNQLGSAQKSQWESAGSAQNFPKRPQISFTKKFPCTSQATISTERKSAARSQEIMEIPAIISETLATLKPQQVNKIPVLTLL